MKKKILLFIISFFLFIPNTYAMSKINSMNVFVEIAESGVATITEEWFIQSQSNTYFEKEFYDVKNVTISDYIISDTNLSTYTYVEKINKKEGYNYTFIDNGKKKKIAFTTDGKEKTLVIQYKVSGMITQFDDIQGLNWYFLNNPGNQEVGSINVYISGPIEFNENNTAIYGIGNNLSCVFNEGKIQLFASNINSNTHIKLMASFTNTLFQNTLKQKGTFQEYYEKSLNSSPIVEDMINFVTSETAIIIVILIIIVVILLITAKVVNHSKNKKKYNGIYPYRKDLVIGEVATVPYYDMIPCDNNLYKMAFYADYFKLVKNRSNLIGAIILKWILEGNAEIINNDEKYSIKLKANINFTNALDMQLYTMLKDASNKMVIDSNKISRYVSKNDEKIINWFDETVKDVILEDYNQHNVNVKKKFGKSKIILNRVIYEDAVKIQGLKRYLLNFNQVPRKTELTEEIYKYLIICSILLGIDKTFSREVLRKNPDNRMAKQLLEYEKIKAIYKNIYNQAEELYKKQKHKRDKNMYNPTIRDK